MSRPKYPWLCRRTVTCWLGLLLLFVLGLLHREPVAGCMVTVCMALAASHTSEAVMTSRKQGQDVPPSTLT